MVPSESHREVLSVSSVTIFSLSASRLLPHAFVSISPHIPSQRDAEAARALASAPCPLRPARSHAAKAGSWLAGQSFHSAEGSEISQCGSQKGEGKAPFLQTGLVSA